MNEIQICLTTPFALVWLIGVVKKLKYFENLAIAGFIIIITYELIYVDIPNNSILWIVFDLFAILFMFFCLNHKVEA